MFQLNSINIKDFFSFEEAKIDFSKGMTLITGYDDNGKDSNGSGKSTILNAICWALFGRTLKGVSGMDVVRWDRKDCKVVLILKGEGHIYEITRSLDKLIFKIDAVVVRGHYRDIQSTIEASFKTNYSLFIRSTAFSQGQVEFLAASGDAEKKRLFKEILSLSRLDKAYDKVRMRYDLQYNKAERLEGELETTHRQKNNLENKIREIQTLQENWEDSIKEKIKNLGEQKVKKPKNADFLSEEIKKLQLVYDVDRLIEDDISFTEKKVYELSSEMNEHDKEITKLQKLIEKGQDIGQRCELCGSVINKKMLGAHRQELKNQIIVLKGKIEELGKDTLDKKTYLRNRYEAKLSREELQKTIENKKRDLALNSLEWEHYHENCKNIDKQIEEVKINDNPYNNIWNSLLTECELVNNKYLGIQKEFEDAKRLIDTLSFIKIVLSREGAVGHIIEREYASLVSYSNRMLSEISGGRLRLSISPQRELKSGALKEEIDIIVYANEQKTTYWGLSDGQRQRVNIALLLALNKLCKHKGINSFDFLLLDEVLDISLAEGGQQDVIVLLKNYLRECSTIILISHKDTFTTSFNSHIEVYRDENGISRLRR